MCGRYTLGVTPARLAEVFALAQMPELAPRYNIAPTQTAPVILDAPGGRQLELRRWGLVPFWAKDPKIGSRMINARGESLAEKPAFRAAFRRQRCLVPADGFYEWKPSGRRKQPYHVRRADARPFAMAGLFDTWHAGKGDAIASFTIVTTDANALLRPIHDRMPVILDSAGWKEWLDPTTPLAGVAALLAPHDPADFEAYPVATLVNSPAVDDARCRTPLREAPV
ncbi:MAG: SOS response-associated peptidase [Deltaproteobacteria bacterium]|nr:SOS response-associated peptidase [Deltaproteobacteria bacterium]